MFNAVCVMAGLNTLVVRSVHTQQERDRAKARFNKKGSGVDVLITSSQLNPFGVNYQVSCSDGVVLENPNNLNTLFQIVGRIWRLGQQNEVRWEFLQTRGTYDFDHLLNCLEKYQRAIAASSALDKRITGVTRQVCASYIASDHAGLRYSVYPMLHTTRQYFFSPEITRECEFYTAFAELLLENPVLAQKFEGPGQALIADLALRWDAEARGLIRVEMLQEPELPAGRGVVLGNFVEAEAEAQTGEDGGGSAPTPKKRKLMGGPSSSVAKKRKLKF